MCWALYLASDKELHIVPWDEASPAFNTQVLSPTDVSVKVQFSLPHVIYVGSHEGCGCGFRSADDDGAEEKAIREKTVHALADYLNNMLTTGARLEMFLCWEGDQGQTPVARKKITPKEFLGSDFPLGEKEYADIISDSDRTLIRDVVDATRRKDDGNGPDNGCHPEDQG